MKKKHFLLIALLALTGGTGTAKNYAQVTSTGAILGSTAGLLPKGSTVVSIAEIVAGATPSTFYVKSRDIYPGAGVTSVADTIYVGNGIAYNEQFPHGCDSLACMGVGAGATLTVTTDNKP